MKKERTIDSEKILYASLLEFMEDDLIKNKTDNFNLTCTFRGHIAGILQEDVYGELRFLDVINDKTFGHLYFNKVSEANRILFEKEINELFVMNANPIKDIGITGKLTKEQLKQKLSKTGLYFNFMDDNEEINKSMIKK